MDMNEANIIINRRNYISTVDFLDETALRGIGDVPDHHEIWEETPGHDDKRVSPGYIVKHYPQFIRRYFTCPRFINAGAV